MKTLETKQLETLSGGYACEETTGQGIGLCYPSLCIMLSGLLADTGSTQFQVCPL